MNELHLLGSYKKIISEKELGILIHFLRLNNLRKIRLAYRAKIYEKSNCFSLFQKDFLTYVKYIISKKMLLVSWSINFIDCASKNRNLNFLRYSRRASQVHWISRSTTKLHMPFTCGVTIARHARARFSVRLLECYILLAGVIPMITRSALQLPGERHDHVTLFDDISWMSCGLNELVHGLRHLNHSRETIQSSSFQNFYYYLRFLQAPRYLQYFCKVNDVKNLRFFY